MARRDLIGEHRRQYGLLPSIRRQAQRTRELQRAPKTGDSYITRIAVGGGGGGGGAGDAADLTYTPAVLADWDGGADPGNQDAANDQLAERVADVEAGPQQYQDIRANRPVSGVAGDTFYATDTDVLYEWDAVAGAWVVMGIYINPGSTMIIDGVVANDFTKSTPYTGTINTVTDATHIKYNDAASQDGCLGPNQVLRNTTRGTKSKIVSVDRAANTIVLEANSPNDATAWQVNDVITTASATNVGRAGAFVDLDVTAWATLDAGMIVQLSSKFMAGATESYVILHPWEAYAEAKEFATTQVQAFWQYGTAFAKVNWQGTRAYVTLFLYMGAATTIRPNLRYVGKAN